MGVTGASLGTEDSEHGGNGGVTARGGDIGVGGTRSTETPGLSPALGGDSGHGGAWSAAITGAPPGREDWEHRVTGSVTVLRQ